MDKKSITFDTSCVMSLLNLPGDETPISDLAALTNIYQLFNNKEVEIYISEKSRGEVKKNIRIAQKNDPLNKKRIEKWVRTLDSLMSYPTTQGRWILGISYLGEDTFLGSDRENEVYMDFSKILFGKNPNDINEGNLFDLVILFEHYIQGNDFFVTRDKKNNMIIKRNKFKHLYNVNIITPVEMVDILVH